MLSDGLRGNVDEADGLSREGCGMSELRSERAVRYVHHNP